MNSRLSLSPVGSPAAYRNHNPPYLHPLPLTPEPEPSRFSSESEPADDPEAGPESKPDVRAM